MAGLKATVFVWISVFALFSVHCYCFYLPGVAPQDFLKVSDLGFRSVLVRSICVFFGNV